jgi:hypothetical protein
MFYLMIIIIKSIRSYNNDTICRGFIKEKNGIYIDIL